MKDLWLNNSGDFVIGPDGDLLLASSLDAVLQSIAFRVKTEPGSVFLHPDIGCELMDLIGMPITEESLALGESIIYNNITYDGLLETDEVTVTAAPINNTQVLFIIEILTPELEKEQIFIIPYDFQDGRVLTDELNNLVIGTDSAYGDRYSS